MAIMLFTSFEVCKRLDIKKERFLEWVDRGYIKPHVRAKGRGTKNLFRLSDIYLISLFRHLLECGFSRKCAAKRTAGLMLKHQDLNDISFLAFPVSKETTCLKNVIIIKEDQSSLEEISRYLNIFNDILFVNFKKLLI